MLTEKKLMKAFKSFIKDLDDPKINTQKYYCELCGREISWRAYYASTNTIWRRAMCKGCWAEKSRQADEKTKERVEYINKLKRKVRDTLGGSF